MRRIVAICGSAAVAGLIFAGHANASDTGVAQALHDMQRYGGRTCLADHFHDGEGSGKSRGAAASAAVSAWAEFTSWEYGTSWGHYGLAANKSMNCSQGGGSWSCHVSARPCRGY